MNNENEIIEINNNQAPENTLYCPYCDRPTEIVDSKVIYRKPGYGLIYLCPFCSAYVGIHKGTLIPKGTPADKQLRELRKQTHYSFDVIWSNKTILKRIVGDIEFNHLKEKNLTYRKIAYLWLAKLMNIEVKHCHIGSFNSEQCAKAIDICNEHI